jgi:tryptophan synthase alpha chain
MRHLRSEGRHAFIPFLTAGFPDTTRCQRLLQALGPFADFVEIGLPFSDPVADGPTICAASDAALARGADTATLFRLIDGARSLPAPIVMTYLNPILAYGTDAFLDRAAAAGVQGLLVTDLPPEDGTELFAAAADRGIASVMLVAPTTPEARMADIAARTTGFLYCVAVRGTTGVRVEARSEARQTVARLRALTDVPVVVGFGIATPEQVRETCRFADGAVVGSALVDWIARHADSEDLVTGFREQLDALAAAAHARE